MRYKLTLTKPNGEVVQLWFVTVDPKAVGLNGETNLTKSFARSHLMHELTDLMVAHDALAAQQCKASLQAALTKMDPLLRETGFEVGEFHDTQDNKS